MPIEEEVNNSFNAANANRNQAVPDNVLKTIPGEKFDRSTYYDAPGGMGGAGNIPGTPDTYVTLEDIYGILSGLSPIDQATLAREMFISVPSAYRSYEDIFNDDGSVNQVGYAYAISATIELAARVAPMENPFFVDILSRESLKELSPEEIQTLFDQRVAEIKESEKTAPRVIRLIDPAALNGILKETYRGSIGRLPNDMEMRQFVKHIHGMQASYPDMQLSPGAQAVEFAAQQNPEEAEAMEYVNAGRLMMNAIGMGGA